VPRKIVMSDRQQAVELLERLPPGQLAEFGLTMADWENMSREP
jgi:hypothetical protein